MFHVIHLNAKFGNSVGIRNKAYGSITGNNPMRYYLSCPIKQLKKGEEIFYFASEQEAREGLASIHCTEGYEIREGEFRK